MLVRLPHHLKAQLPTEAMEAPRATLFRPLQPLKADAPIVVTESGIVTVSRTLQELKA